MASTTKWESVEEIDASDATMAAGAAAAHAAAYRPTPRIAFPSSIPPPIASMSSAQQTPTTSDEPLVPPKVAWSSPSVPPWRNVRFQPITDCRPTSSRSLHSVASSPICRICHETGVRDPLLSPCKCRGSVALVHRGCIERWLSTANTDSCEICGFRYRTVRKERGFVEWITSASEMADLRNLLGDVCCFILLTPLTTVSAWLCISGAVHYARSPFSGPGGWETVGLMSLSIFLVVVFCVWCLSASQSSAKPDDHVITFSQSQSIQVAIRYHMRVFVEWRQVHQIVTLLLPPPSEAVVAVDDGRRRQPATDAGGGKLPRDPTAAGSEPQQLLPADVIHELLDSRPLYSRCRTNGGWRFGRLPATSVSDTAAASTLTFEHVTDV